MRREVAPLRCGSREGPPASALVSPTSGGLEAWRRERRTNVTPLACLSTGLVYSSPLQPGWLAALILNQSEDIVALEALAALQIGQLDQESNASDMATQLLDQLHRC